MTASSIDFPISFSLMILYNKGYGIAQSV